MLLNNLTNFGKKIGHEVFENSNDKIKIHQDILNDKKNLNKISDLEKYIEASISALEMLKDITETMIDITKEASIISENGQIMTKYNKHLLSLKNEFFNVVKTWKYNNRSIFLVVNKDTDYCDECSLDDLIWKLPVVLNEDSNYTVKTPKLSLGKLKFDDNTESSYNLKLNTIDQNDYISNLSILKNNYKSIEKIQQKAHQMITRLNIRKSTISVKISGLEDSLNV